MKKSLNVPVIFVLVIVGILLIFLAGHSTGYRSAMQADARGFQLPPGDVEAGKAVFESYGCQQCHTVRGSREFAIPTNTEAAHIMLGGRVRVMKPCGELVTSIIDPQESVKPDAPDEMLGPEGQSTMPDLTARMTTRELADLVAFLRSHYEIEVAEYPDGRPYYPYGVDIVP